MAYSPTPIRRESVISQAAQEICRCIEAERLSPGDALPPETRLSEMLGISRNSVREALRVLHGLAHDAEARAQYLADAPAFADKFQLPPDQRDALIKLDLQSMVKMGAHPLVPFLAQLQIDRLRPRR